ncbi:MAG: DinB family protein [Chloroflexi bacterium]|nr:DinB family protein [Chloroflexota bacterium]
MDKQTLTSLFNYHYWANRQLWRVMMTLSEKQFTQTLSDGSPSIRTQIVRMVANENLWVNYLWHGEVEFLQESHIPTRSCIREEWDALEEEIHDFIDELSPADLESRVDPAFLDTHVSLSVGEILLQIIHQATECRAQIRLHLSRLGSPPFAQDFIDFLVEQDTRRFLEGYRLSNPELRI